MAPLTLTGPTLGARHQQLNEMVNTDVSKKVPFEDINKHEEISDVDVMYKIDIAAKYRNVEYILQVLKSEDIFHVSRAIKRSNWLISDKQYAHIVNPDYLYQSLFPLMTFKAQHKFLLHVRLFIKDEQRAEQFYKYYIKEKQATTAVKWLPYCSVPFIEQQIVPIIDHLNETKLIARLVERSLTVLDLFRKHRKRYYGKDVFQTGVIWLQSKTEEFFDILDNFENSDRRMPKFCAKQTKFILNKCPHRIIEKFIKYYRSVSLKEVGRHIGQKNIKGFLLKHATKQNEYDLNYESLKDLINMMPNEGKFEFIRYMFIDKKYLKQTTYEENTESTLPKGLYKWYSHAPFDTAYSEIIKLVRSESSPDERVAMLSLLVSCAKHGQDNVKTILQYYHDKHINEPYKYKSQFVNKVLMEVPTYRFDELCWSLLDNLFRSMEVYVESNNNVQNCLEAIILYKLLNNQPIPQIVEQKFNFSTMKYCFSKTDIQNNEKEIIFNYLYNNTQAKINALNLNVKEEFINVIEPLIDIVMLLSDWKKDVRDYPFVLESFIKVLKINKEMNWGIDLVVLFDMYKRWQKHLFEYSLIMSPNDDVCLHVLKHDLGMFSRYQAEMDKLRCGSDKLDRLHKKIRIYYPKTSSEWISNYRGWLQQTSAHKAVVRALCLLLTQKELNDFIEQYRPSVMKIDWSNADEQIVSLQKNISKQMYIARPQPAPELVISYAKGDYLQYALPSLIGIFYNMSTDKCRKHIFSLLSAPVSVQKNGIRIAFSKLKQEELLELFSICWKKTKNASIRAVIFLSMYEILCKQEDEIKARQMWAVLSIFIDDLTGEENSDIYSTLKDLNKVPYCVRAEFCVKSYNFLKSLPEKAGCESYVYEVADIAGSLMEIIDPQFIHDILISYSKYTLDELIENCTLKNVFMKILSDYLLYAKDEKTQMQRYNQILVPFTKRIFEKWNEDQKYKNTYWKVINRITSALPNHLVVKDLVVPVAIFTDMLNKITNKVSATLYEEYTKITSLKIITQIINIFAKESYLERCNPNVNEKKREVLWQNALRKAVPKIAELLNQSLKDEINNFFPSIYALFCKAIAEAFNNLNITSDIDLNLCESLLEYKDTVTYLLIIKHLPKHIYDEELSKKLRNIKKAIIAHPCAEVKLHFYKRFEDDF